MSTRLTPPLSERDHVLGPREAPVELVEYGDYECAYCGMAYPIVSSILQQMGDTLRFAFRHFPLTGVHAHAENAAEMAEIAGSRRRFWAMHDMLYRNQHALDDRHLVAYAAQVGIDPDETATELLSHRFADRVREDLISGERSGVSGTRRSSSTASATMGRGMSLTCWRHCRPPTRRPSASAHKLSSGRGSAGGGKARSSSARS